MATYQKEIGKAHVFVVPSMTHCRRWLRPFVSFPYSTTSRDWEKFFPKRYFQNSHHLDFSQDFWCFKLFCIFLDESNTWKNPCLNPKHLLQMWCLYMHWHWFWLHQIIYIFPLSPFLYLYIELKKLEVTLCVIIKEPISLGQTPEPSVLVVAVAHNTPSGFSGCVTRSLPVQSFAAGPLATQCCHIALALWNCA